MKKTYCDVCGIECDDIERQNAIELSHSIPTMKDGTDVGVLLLPDICWDCRDTIANFIRTRMKGASKRA